MKLEIREIQKSYGKKQVLQKVSLWVKEGECAGIIGANGCGKSTLLKIIAGIEKADGGSIFLNGEELKDAKKRLIGQIGYLPQESVLIPELTVEDNLRLWAGIGDDKKNKRTLARLREKFQTDAFSRERVKNLSGGMKKRVDLICALIHEPAVLLMDEPSAALDLVFKEELKGYIRDFTAGGGSVLLSSHDQSEMMQCQRLWVMEEGISVPVPEGTPVEAVIAGYGK